MFCRDFSQFELSVVIPVKFAQCLQQSCGLNTLTANLEFVGVVSLLACRGAPTSGSARPKARYRLTGLCSRNDVLDVAEMHFVFGLLSPTDRPVRVGIRRIVDAVVKPTCEADRIATMQCQWLSKPVQKLPVEVVTWNVQQGFLTAGGQRLVTSRFASQMHVRQERQNLNVDRKPQFRDLRMIVGMWRNADP